MIESKTEKLNNIDRTLSLDNPGTSALSSLRFISNTRFGPSNQTELVKSCCSLVTNILIDLQNSGYSLWVLLIGPSLSHERRARIPDYSLGRSLRKCDIVESAAKENTFLLGAEERMAGVYRLDFGKFEDICRFMTHNYWSISIFSNRTNFDHIDNLEAMYYAGGFDNVNKVTLINWWSLSHLLCPVGDIIIKMEGAFDDRDRIVNLIYSPQFAPSFVTDYCPGET